MAKKPSIHQASQSSTPACLPWVRLLLAAALVVDGYLAWTSLTGGVTVGCGPASNCHSVLSSRWAYWFGIPVSVLALCLSSGLLMTTFRVGNGTAPARRRHAWSFLIAGAIAMIGAALWFVGLQVFVLRTICPYCMTAHACALLASTLLLVSAPSRRSQLRTEPRASEVPIGAGLVRRLALAGGAAVVVLIGGQLVWQPKSYQSQSITAGVATNRPSAQALAPVRQFQILDGKFAFNLEEVPLIGRPNAPHVLVSLFDYTCHHCRDMHPYLLEAYQRFSNDLAIVSLPMPLDSKCNPMIQQTFSQHINACALARLGLIVWRAQRQAAPQFDDFVFTSAQPPLPAVAERSARALVGSDNFDRTATNAWVAEQLRRDVSIYMAVYQKFRKGAMPEVMIGTNLISGPFNRDVLSQLLASQFGLASK